MIPNRSEPSKRILITGGLGYIGSVLSDFLTHRGHDCTVIDAGFFAECALAPVKQPCRILRADLREFQESWLNGIDAVVHLAGISNDPVGNLAPERVYDPTRVYAFHLAKICKNRGMGFVFASSCSIYGRGLDELNEESSVNPQTPYSLNKLQIEQDLTTLTDSQFTPVCLRFATIYGPSPRMRFDLFINMMAAMAVCNGEILLNSDGKAWRPSLHILDACEAVHRAIHWKKQSGHTVPLILNVGQEADNCQVINVAETIAAKVPGCRMTLLAPSDSNGELIRDRKIKNLTDSRTYRVCFNKIKETFPEFKCSYSLNSGIASLIEFFRTIRLNKTDLSNPKFYRLQWFEDLYKKGLITDDLCWKNPSSFI